MRMPTSATFLPDVPRFRLEEGRVCWLCLPGTGAVRAALLGIVAVRVGVARNRRCEGSLAGNRRCEGGRCQESPL